MTDVGVERFSARDGEKDRAENHETALAPIRSEKLKRRAHGFIARKHFRRAADLVDAENGEASEPQKGDRPKDAANSGRARSIERRKARQNHDRDRDDIGIEKRRRDVQSLHRAQDGNCRRDHPVGVEQRRAKQSEEQE